MAGILEKVKQWFGSSGNSSDSAVKEESTGSEPVATPPEGLGDDERETSTDAQTAEAADEPWSGNDEAQA